MKVIEGRGVGEGEFGTRDKGAEKQVEGGGGEWGWTSEEGGDSEGKDSLEELEESPGEERGVGRGEEVRGGLREEEGRGEKLMEGGLEKVVSGKRKKMREGSEGGKQTWDYLTFE